MRKEEYGTIQTICSIAGNHLSKGQQRNIVMTTDSNDPRTCVREKIASQQKPEDETFTESEKCLFRSTGFKFVILIVQRCLSTRQKCYTSIST